MKKLPCLLAFALLMGFSACNKEQAVVKKLAGDWTVDQLDLYEDGVMVYSGPNEERLEFSFEECKLKKDEWCEMKINYPDEEGFSESAHYQITDEGEKILLDTDNNFASTEDRIEITIVELEKDHLVFHFTEIDDASTKYQFHLSPK